jgi:hypothetical protein
MDPPAPETLMRALEQLNYLEALVRCFLLSNNIIKQRIFFILILF